ncbi:Threonylcarbamoyladenosine tRNA methylthiotransferase MtaB [compost metagenome]
MQLQYAEKFVGQVLEVIPERDEKGLLGDGRVAGFSDNYLQICFDGAKDLTGKMCRVKLTKAGINTNEGQLVRVLEDLEETSQALA